MNILRIVGHRSVAPRRITACSVPAFSWMRLQNPGPPTSLAFRYYSKQPPKPPASQPSVPRERPSPSQWPPNPPQTPHETPPTPPTPSPPPRITKEQLMAQATNFFQRVRLRLKWFFKRSNRPYNTDDFSAMVSWLMVGNVLLFVLGTTTFVSLVIFTANTVFAQEFVARKLGEFITKNSNLRVTFENAIVPGWKDGMISFRKCFVSRRPRPIAKESFTRGSQQEAYAESLSSEYYEDDGNYTQFDLTMEEVNISLSLRKWLNGTGIVETLQIKGMRGVVDRTHVHWDPDDDATNYKNVAAPGDFWFEKFSMEDVLFTLYQPNGFRPFDVAVYNCELSQLRKHWLFYDFLNADSVSGAYDNSLFTIHKKQRLDDYTGESSKWKRITRCRVDKLNIDHLNTGLEGPFGWITSGKVDMIGDVMVPRDEHNMNVAEVVNLIAESIKKEATRYKNPEVKEPAHGSLHTRLTSADYTDITKYFVLDLTIRLNHVRASVPFKSPDLSYINYALIRPIVGYINSKNTIIEVKNRIVKNLQDFSGSWTVYDSLLMDDISEEVYDNFAEYVTDEQERLTRMKKVGFWTLQVLLQFCIFGIGMVA
ncbi:mitochondrial distribution and morphology protein 31 [Diutina catenulata]